MTAVEGDDYVFSNGNTVTIQPDATMGSLMVDIIDDMAIEGPHSFTVTIMSVAMDSAVMIGTPSSTEVSIMDNDGNTVILLHYCSHVK